MGLFSTYSRYRINYKLEKKEHFVYLVHIPHDGVAKVGRTCRLRHRLHNLRQSLYRPHVVYVIACSSSNETLRLEKYLLGKLPRKISGEWFSEVTPSDVQSLLIDEWGHVLLVPHQKEDDIPEAKIKESRSFVIELL